MKFSTPISSLLVVFSLAISHQVMANTCDWLPVEKVNALAPSQSPWKTQAGGQAGMCMFESQKRTGDAPSGAMLSFTQMFQPTAADAAKNVKELRAAIQGDYKIQNTPTLGANAFTYRSKETGPQSTAFWSAHQGPVVLMATYFGMGDISDATVVELEKVVKAALDGSQGKNVKAAAASCPGLSEALAKKLLPTSNFRVQRFGDTSCMATDSTNSSVLATITEATDSTQVIQNLRDSATKIPCTVEDVPALGKGAFMQSRCAQGTSAVQVQFLVGDFMAEVTFAPVDGKTHPTTAQKAILIDIAKAWAIAPRSGLN